MRATYKSDTLHPMVGMPMPRYHLLKKNRHVNRTFVQTSRGCHQGCTFCAEPLMNGLKFRYRPVEEVIHEVENRGARTISINDADFFGTPERPKEVMRALKGGVTRHRGNADEVRLQIEVDGLDVLVCEHRFVLVAWYGCGNRKQSCKGRVQRSIHIQRAGRQRIRFRIDQMNDAGMHENPLVARSGPVHTIQPHHQTGFSLPHRSARIQTDQHP
jgi:hypothetical protein